MAVWFPSKTRLIVEALRELRPTFAELAQVAILKQIEEEGEGMSKKKSKRQRPLSVTARLTSALKTVEEADRLNSQLERDLLVCRAKISELQERLDDFRWRTHDGQVLKPTEMSDRHLQNTISYLQRTLTHKFGNTRWLQSCRESTRALYEMLKEADRRALDV